jgi:hypothetical protein
MALLIVLLWALLGFVIGTTLGLAIAPLFGFPDMEGSPAIFAVLLAGPAGALAGVVAAVAILRRVPSGAKRTRLAGITVAGIAGLMLIGWLATLLGGGGQLSQSASTIAFEIRLPPGMAAPKEKSDVEIRLRSAKDNGKASLHDGLWRRQDGDRDVMRGVIEFFHVAKERTIAMRIGDGPTHLFKLRIPARPKSSPGLYEAWFPVDLVEDNMSGKGQRPPAAGEVSEIRYFVTVPD